MLVRLRRTLGVVGVLVGLVLVAGPAAAVIKPGPINPVALDGITSSEAILKGWTSSSGTHLQGGRTGWVVGGSTYFQTATAPNSADHMSPGAGSMSEPYWDNVAQRWQVIFTHTFPNGGAPPDNMTGWYGYNNLTSWCSATAKGSPTATSGISSSGFLVYWQGPTATKGLGSQPCPGARPYLQYITVDVYEGYELGNATITRHYWYGSAYRAGGLVEDPPDDYCDIMHDAIPPGAGQSGFGFCAGAGGGAGGGGGGEWDDLTGDLSSDAAADFSEVCKNPPAAEWLSFSWLGPWVGHYAKCLFIPKFGFSGQQAEDALDESFVGDVSVLGEFDFDMPSATSCGVLAQTELVNKPVVINTCGSPFSSLTGIRDQIGRGLVVMTVVGVCFMLLRVVGVRIRTETAGGD